MTRSIHAVALYLCLSTPLFAVETEVLFEGFDLADWSTQRDQERLKQEFSLSEVAAAKDPAALQWRFVSKGIGFNDLFLLKPLTRPFDVIRVRVKNEGEPFVLAMKARDDSGAEWTTTACL